MEYVLLATAGVVGSGWTGYPNPDDPDSPMCPVCIRVIGAIAAIILYVVLRDMIGADAGIATLSLVGFLGGSAGAALVNGVINLARGGKKTGA